jgi:hypothetical protein
MRSVFRRLSLRKLKKSTSNLSSLTFTEKTLKNGWLAYSKIRNALKRFFKLRMGAAELGEEKRKVRRKEG